MRDRWALVAFRMGSILLVFTTTILLATGCSRMHYRDRADRDVYAIEEQRRIDPRWDVPPRPVEASPISRMSDPHDPDAEPIPPDDPAARLYQISLGRPFEFHGWKDRGSAPVEDLTWLKSLPSLPDGSVPLNRESVVELALLHSRDYQLQVEQLYLAALALSLARFEFQFQPFFATVPAFFRQGGGANRSDQFTLDTNAILLRNFYSGAQLAVEFTNALLFEATGAGAIDSVRSVLLINAVQPLLRGAFTRIVTQGLSLQERGVLYALRDFAQFRRGFYVETVAGYLDLLALLQSIRNAEENLQATARNLAETEALVVAAQASLIQRDQVAQQYQAAQLTLVNQQVNLETALDFFRIGLGLPPDLPVTLDDAPLDMFELNDPRLEDLRQRNDELYLSLLQDEAAPPLEVLDEAAGALIEGFAELRALLDEALGEMFLWRTRLGLIDALGERPLPPDDLEDAQASQVELAERLRLNLQRTSSALDESLQKAILVRETLDSTDPEEVWTALRDLSGRAFRTQFSDLFVSQAQVRVYLIELTPVELTSEQAVEIALVNRLDLMNALGQVTDTWRNVEVAANSLRSGLNLRYTGNLATDDLFRDIFRFDASASSHRFGLEFDAPLTRFIERNAYRAAQIDYQRARRGYMSSRDEIVRQIRLDIRQLDLNRRQFEIARESLLIAARQIEESELNLRFSNEPDSSLTIFLLNALSDLLTAKNALIGNWVAYETTRLQLYRDFDLMNIDAEGVWINEQYLRTSLGSTDQPRADLELPGPDFADIPPLPELVAPGPDPFP